MKTKTFSFGMLFLALIITSCKKDDCDCNIDESATNGYINVNISGLSKSGISLNDSFIADKYKSSYIDQDNYYTDFENIQKFYINRCADKIDSDKSISIYFQKTGNTISNITIGLDYTKRIDENTVLTVYPAGDYVNNGEITNFSFDMNSNILKGNYKVVYDYNYWVADTAIRKTTVSGDFNIQMTKRLY